jgi:hypothetical protein
MSATHVINSLRRKRAEVSGAIRDLETRIHALKRDLAHIDATLKMFDPNGEPKTIKPVRPYRPRNRLFEPKELSIRVMTALREADGNAAAVDAIAERIMADKGLKEPAGHMIRGVVAVALRGLRKRGVVALSDETPPRWHLVSAQPVFAADRNSN